MIYREAINLGEKVLNMADVADAKIDAWLLLEMVCKIDRSFYYLHMEDEVAEEQLSEYEIALRKRAEHVPLQYIVGEAEFMGLKFKVNSNVLIPRQDTETLVEEALKVVKPGMKVLDMCTGSGCIIVSIVHNIPEVEGTATDISKQALLVAKENAKLNQVSVTFERSDLFDNVTGTYDVIVSNPPYIRTGEVVKLMPEVQEFEPMEALDGKEFLFCKVSGLSILVNQFCMIYFLQCHKIFCRISSLCAAQLPLISKKCTFSNSVRKTFHRIWTWLSIRLHAWS